MKGPALAFLFSVGLACFAFGVAVGEYKIWPYSAIHAALQTGKEIKRVALDEPFAGDVVPESRGSAPRAWETRAPSGPERMLAVGGLGQYPELCPEAGCLAVILSRTGEVETAIPYRPEALIAADITEGAFAYETLAFDPRRQLRPISVRPYPGGDYIVTFNATGGLFPYGGGIGRVAPDGTPRWFRFDYTHHWANLAEDGTILVPGMRIGTAADGQRLPPRARCKSNRPMIDTLRVIDGEGAILREIDLYEALLDANFEGLLATTHNPCDPLHLNFVHPIGADATAGLTPGDYLVSLRNISAVAVIDRITGAVKRMIHGNFEHQHAAQHIGGSKIVLFDNWGGDLDGPASQIVEIDLATGAERTVFPIPGGDQEIPDRFSLYAGTINLSPDRRRILTAYTWNGHGYEIDLATGALLGVYENRHPTGGGETARYYLFDLSYLLP